MTGKSNGQSRPGSKRTEGSSCSRESGARRSTPAGTMGSPRSSGLTRPARGAGSPTCSTRRPSELGHKRAYQSTFLLVSRWRGAGGSMRTAAVIAVALLLSSTFLSAVPKVAAQGEPAFLVVGDRDQMRSRNVLRVPLGPVTGEDVGVGIFQAVYSTPVLTGPVADEVRPYIAKGVDADEDGVFEPSEYGVFLKNPGTNSTDVVAYFDFNGVRWHDGVQLTPMDLYFSLAMASLNPRSNPDFRVLWDRGGGPGSNFTWTRWIAVSAVRKAWIGEGSIPGDSSLRVALQFRLQKPYPMFYERTLGNLWLLPRHVWEDNGGGRHPDFGRAVYPEGDPRAGQGMPVNETSYKPFDFAAAETWEPIDADVVGSGPFRFGTWAFGQLTRLDRMMRISSGRTRQTPASCTTRDSRGRSTAPMWGDSSSGSIARCNSASSLCCTETSTTSARRSRPSSCPTS